MFGSVQGVTWDSALQQLTAALDELHSLELATLSGEEELQVLARLETVKNRLPTVEHRLIADVEPAAPPTSMPVGPRRCCRANCCASARPRPAPGSRPPPTSARGVA